MKPREDDDCCLAQQLRVLGRSFAGPDDAAETMAERVLAQLLAENVPPPGTDPTGGGVEVRYVPYVPAAPSASEPNVCPSMPTARAAGRGTPSP